jgi:hypothetical protein
MEGVEKIPGLSPLHDTTFAISTITSDTLNLFSVWKMMVDRGWFTSAIMEPVAIHLMVQPFHIEVMDKFLTDLAESAELASQSESSTSDDKPRYN